MGSGVRMSSPTGFSARAPPRFEQELSTAVTLLHQAASTAEEDHIAAAAWKNLGIALRRSGEDDQALEAFRCALSLDAADTEALYSVGNTYMAMGRHTDAIGAFQRVRQLDPTFAKAANNEGAAWMALSQSSRAEACFLAATELDPTSGQHGQTWVQPERRWAVTRPRFTHSSRRSRWSPPIRPFVFVSVTC